MPTLPPAHILAAAPGLWSQAGQGHWVPVQGQSMLPLMRPGDEVWVVPGAARLRRGEVLVLTTPTGLLVHRLLRAEPGAGPRRLLTQGDNNRRPDPAASSQDVLGRVLAIRRQGGTLALGNWRWRACGWLIASGMLALRHLDTPARPWVALGRLGAGAVWRLLRLFCRLACR